MHPFKKIPLPAYVTWVLIHSCMLIPVIVDYFQKLFRVSNAKAKIDVAKWIPYLCKRGFSTLQIIPKKE